MDKHVKLRVICETVGHSWDDTRGFVRCKVCGEFKAKRAGKKSFVLDPGKNNG